MDRVYFGSNDLLVSTANKELIQQHAPRAGYEIRAYKFSFMNNENCHVKINGSGQILLQAGQGFNIDKDDEKILSFVIVEAGITYNYIGLY